jgi:hypothetical protein
MGKSGTVRIEDPGFRQPDVQGGIGDWDGLLAKLEVPLGSRDELGIKGRFWLIGGLGVW